MIADAGAPPAGRAHRRSCASPGCSPSTRRGAGLDDVPDDDLRHPARPDQRGLLRPGRDRVRPRRRAVEGAARRRSPASSPSASCHRSSPPAPPSCSSRRAPRPRQARCRSRYLADLAVALDPTRCATGGAAVPPDRIGEVAAEMFRRREYAAMAELAGAVTREALSPRWRLALRRDLLEPWSRCWPGTR